VARALVHGPRITSPRTGESSRRFRWVAALNAGWVGTILLFGTAAVSLYLIQMSAVATGGYELQRLESERDGWQARNEQLELELAKRRSLAWAEAQAVERLSMVRSEPPRYLEVPSGPTLAARSARGGSRPTDAVGRGGSTPGDGLSARPQPGDPGALLAATREWILQSIGR
jgi:hypothetical protein